MSTVICNDPFAVEFIDLDECVGLSLSKINHNYKNLVSENCLTYEELEIIKNDFSELSANLLTLSALEQAGVYPKAWINFDGTVTPPEIISVYSISGVPTITSVQKYNIGTYGLSLNTNFSNSDYILIGTAKQVSATPCFVQYSPTTAFTSTSANINIMTPSGTLVDSDYVSITIYSQ
jgi:hypothetical protein